MDEVKYVKILEDPRKGYFELGFFAIGMGIFFRGFHKFYGAHRDPLLPTFQLGWFPEVGCGLLVVAGIVVCFWKSKVFARITAVLVILTFAIVPPLQWTSGDWKLTSGLTLLMIVTPLTLYAMLNIK